MSLFGEIVASYFDYNTLKILHLFGVIIFMGNIIVTGWWKVTADRTGDYRIVAFAQRLTDWVFTFGGVLIVLISAFGMVYHMNENIMAQVYSVRWLWWGYYLLIASGIIWGIVLIPIQIVQARMARKFALTGDIPPRYWIYGRIWLWFGILAIVIPLANIYWMVMKS